MDKRYILFDLDGTLTDSYEGIKNGFVYALEKMGVEPKPDTFRKCIGPPIIESLKSLYGFSAEEADRGTMLFREYYSVTGVYENKVYTDMETVLKTLRAHDKKLMVATAKPEVLAERVLNHFNLRDYFCFVAGVTNDLSSAVNDPSQRSTKKEVISYILKENAIYDRENTVMVGDRASDITAAKAFGLQTIGVSYGYGTEEELTAAGADYIAKTPMDLIGIIV